MCTVIEGDCGCGSRSGGGPSIETVAVTIAVAAAIGLTYQVFALAPYFFLFVLYPAVALVVTRRGRWVLRWAVKLTVMAFSGVVLVVRWWRRRRQPVPAPSVEVAAVRAWQVTVYEPAGDTNRVITRGVVEGEWATSTELEAETIARAVEKFGWDNAGRLRAHAQLVSR